MLKNIFDMRSAVWFGLGFTTSIVYNFMKSKTRTEQIRCKAEKKDNIFKDTGIISLAHGNPFFIVDEERKDFEMGMPEDVFYVSMPEEIKEKILKYNPDFFNTKWEESEHFLENMTEQEMIEEISLKLGFPKEEMKIIYNESKREAAELLLEKVEAGKPYFNGEMYGICKVQEKRIKENEIPAIKIASYKTDYYTHRVMSMVYQKAYKRNTRIVPSDVEKFNEMRYFLTSFGMNVLLILEDENKVVFVKRSGDLVNMQRSLWHDSANEAVSIIDASETGNTISLEKCVRRGLGEELGLCVDDFSIFYGDLFFLKNPFEPGISAFVKVKNLSYLALKILYSAARDKEFESEDIIAVPFTIKDLENFVKSNDLTETAQYMVKMLLARLLKGEI